MRARPLSRRDFDHVSVALHELGRPDLDREALQATCSSLLPIFGAADVSLHLQEVSAGKVGATTWYHGYDSTAVRRLVATRPEGHTGMRTFRALPTRVSRFVDLPESAREPFLRSEFVRTFRRDSGLGPMLAGHLGTRPGESLGWINWWRPERDEEFDDERRFVYRAMVPAFSAAVRRVLSRESGLRGDGETALVDGGGAVLWMTDGFRFLWNALTVRPLPSRRLSPAELLDPEGTPLERAIAFRIIVLDFPDGPGRLPPEVVVPCPGGGPDVEVSFDAADARSIGRRGRVLRIRLGRRASECGEPA